MKTAKRMISAKLRNYGKNTTKKNLDQSQVMLEIRNYTPQIYRISAKHKNLELLCLKPSQMKKGLCIGRSDSSIINARLEKLKNRLDYVLNFMIYLKYDINKPNIENWLYVRFHDVYHYFTEVEPAILWTNEDGSQELTNTEDQDQFFDYLSKTPEQLANDRSIEKNRMYELGINKPIGIIEALQFETLDGVDKNYILNFLRKWLKSINQTDYPISQFDKKMLDQVVNFIVELPKEIKRNKNNKEEHYAVKTLKNFVKWMKIYFKSLKELDYQINENVFDFKVIAGTKKGHVPFIQNEQKDVISITKDELKKIKFAMNDKKLSGENRQAATLFVIQTLLGGLRISELNAIKKESFHFVNDTYLVTVQAKKTARTLLNPLSDQLEPILKKIDFDLDKLRFKSDRKYNLALHQLAIDLKFERKIVKYDTSVNLEFQKPEFIELYKVFTNKLARKAAISLLFYENYPLDKIAKMTEHSLNAIQSYVAILLDDKAKMMSKL